MLNEGIEFGDLARLVQPVLTIDEFRSKMGDDKDIIVLGFTVHGEEPAQDLVNFIEKSYDWVLDADVSSGEMSDGNYIVFVEIIREKQAVDKIMTIIDDTMNLTDQEIDEWTFSYYKDAENLPFTKENLSRKLILTPEEYELKTGSSLEESAALNHLRSISGIQVKPIKTRDPYILDIQIAAGIR